MAQSNSKYYYSVDGGCVLCMMCTFECRWDAIYMEDGVSARIHADQCMGCGKCADNCQVQAIIRHERVNAEK